MTDRQPEIRTFSTLTPGAMQDASLQRLRTAPPVFWAPLERSWVLHRHAEVNAVLADRHHQVAELGPIIDGVCARSGQSAPALTGLLSVFLPFINPPAHDLSRRYLRAVLSDRRPAEYAPVIEQIAQDLLSAIPDGADFDATVNYADLIPPLFIGHFLGIPGPVVVNFVVQTAEMGRTFDRGCSPRYFLRMEALIREQRLPFQSFVAQRRRDPDDSGTARMIALADAMYPMPDDVIADHVMFLIMAASENTAALIGNAIASVIEAGLVERLAQADDRIFRPAIEEALRFCTPVQQMWRTTAADITLAGTQIAAGERLLLLTGAANRDPLAYPDADRFDPWRANRRSFGFGLGHHFCLGAELALLEGEIALRLLIRRHPRPDPARPFLWRERQTLRRALSLPLHLTSRKGRPS